MFSKATDTLLRGQQPSCTIAFHYPVFIPGIRNVFWDLKLQDSKEILFLQETADKCLKNRCAGQHFVQVRMLKPHLQISLSTNVFQAYME